MGSAERETSDEAARRAALAYLAGRMDYERNPPPAQRAFKLERMRRLLELAGAPQAGLPIVHVAGTKGKGSTATMIASALTAAGRRTGLFTSPHLRSVEERWTVDGQVADPGELAELVELVRAAADPLDREANSPDSLGRPTFFELTTAMALLHFRRRRCDAAVLEVGLGGRLDSTNVCDPVVTVVTTISFDHMQLLGDTLAAIAAEKAGIFKPGVPAITGVRSAEPRAVIERAAERVGAPLAAIDREFHYRERPGATGGAASTFDYWEPGSGGARFAGLELGMHGAHQALNGAVAVAVVRELQRQGWPIGEAALRTGLATARCPARVEFFSGSPLVVLDAAHNVASIEALVQVLNGELAGRRGRLVFAASADKEVERMLERLAPRFDQLYLTRFVENPRSVPPEELARMVADLVRRRGAEAARDAGAARESRPAAWTTCERPDEAWRRALAECAPGEFLCVAGSFFLAAELRPLVVAREGRKPEVGK